MLDYRNYFITENLRDGRPVTVRAVRPDDKDKIIAAFHELEPESIYSRYFQHKRALTAQELKNLTEIDFDEEVVLVVTTEQSGQEIIIGSARFIAYKDVDGHWCAEIAFTVEEDYHGQGIASSLMRHLTRLGRDRGLARFRADVLPGNNAMLAVFSRSGLPMTTEPHFDVVHVTLDLSSD